MHKEGIPNLTRNTARSNPVNVRLHQCSAEETQLSDEREKICPVPPDEVNVAIILQHQQVQALISIEPRRGQASRALVAWI